MPAKNFYHDAVVRALLSDGWTVTHDPLTISYGGKDLFVDIGAERMTVAAEKGGVRIAVEVQSFLVTVHRVAYTKRENGGIPISPSFSLCGQFVVTGLEWNRENEQTIS